MCMCIEVCVDLATSSLHVHLAVLCACAVCTRVNRVLRMCVRYKCVCCSPRVEDPSSGCVEANEFQYILLA